MKQQKQTLHTQRGDQNRVVPKSGGQTTPKKKRHVTRLLKDGLTGEARGNSGVITFK